jgi:heat shock protein HslJ
VHPHSPGFESPPERRYKDNAECNVVNGHWWIDGDGLEFVYRRATREVGDDGHLTPTKRWTEHMRLEMHEGKLAVVGGREPLYAVPERQQ